MCVKLFTESWAVVGAGCCGPRLRSVDEAAQQRRYRQHDDKQDNAARLGFLVLWPVNAVLFDAEDGEWSMPPLFDP